MKAALENLLVYAIVFAITYYQNYAENDWFLTIFLTIVFIGVLNIATTLLAILWFGLLKFWDVTVNYNKNRREETAPDMFKTRWTHRPVELTEAEQKILDRELADIAEELDSASDLISHTVFLTGNMDGPIIAIAGQPGKLDEVLLTYYETPGWVKLSTVE